MATRQSVLFSWDDVERLPELRRLGFVLDQLPDADIVAALDRGRDEYPVSAMWRALVSGVVFGHESSASLLRELGRNPALLSLCGFDPLGRQSPRGGRWRGARTGRRWRCASRARGGTARRRRGRSRASCRAL